MKSTPEIETEHRSRCTLAALLHLLVCVVAVTMAAAVPAHGYTTYSGAAVGSNGIIWAWGVTDATSGWYMPHTAYVRTTLTSPKNRFNTSGRISGPNVIRADINLSWDPTDTGIYLVSSFHDYYCVVMGAVVLGSTQGSVSNAYP